jgi:hypothetical protein
MTRRSTAIRFCHTTTAPRTQARLEQWPFRALGTSMCPRPCLRLVTLASSSAAVKIQAGNGVTRSIQALVESSRARACSVEPAARYIDTRRMI